jgi:transposase
MASLQRYTSRGNQYWRIVESFRRPDGKPATRTLVQIGKADDLLALIQGQQSAIRVRSVASGAVDSLWHLAQEFQVERIIDEAVTEVTGKPARMRDGLSVGQSLLAILIGRACRPSSKRAFAQWAHGTSLPGHLHVDAEVLTSQHFWDQMDALPVDAIAKIEQAIVREVVKAERLSPQYLAYDTTNFFTYIDTRNQRTKLPQRGHNKQRRHDLRQLGLALVVSEDGQIPLGHVLYEGAQPDVKTFAQEIAPLRARMHELLGRASQLTFVFDQGAESKANLAALDGQEHFVTCLKPSHHKAWLADVYDKLDPIALSDGEDVRAHRTTHLVHGVDRPVVVLWSQELYEGQRRGYEEDLRKAWAGLTALAANPTGDIHSVRQKAERICNRQYVRESLTCEVTEKAGKLTVHPTLDEKQHRRLLERYFGYRILATTRQDWTTAEIIEAYRGQSRVEGAFRDLKDPWFCAFRPQYHWTDQKLLVHALTSMLALVLSRVLLRRAQQRAHFNGSLRTLLEKLSSIRTATIIDTKTKGRPRVRHQTEEVDKELQPLIAALGISLG